MRTVKWTVALLLGLTSGTSLATGANADPKTSAEFADLEDLDAATIAKFDALINAGIFDGVSDSTFGLKEEMNRAQFAKVPALITGLNVNEDLKASSFVDVKASDPANGYALPYIEALKNAGITDGYGGGRLTRPAKSRRSSWRRF
ncbi:S-layer homology domain-containing protein [Paenibacillus glycinis]|uniref:S-layer homology domain-containing protein n=1 Tax=Paenibacillus glycinis TaxID=2697035 RepID=UPI001F2E137B|nr:S-layer homology domain-containing protein [Paenibacillus glycinis]